MCEKPTLSFSRADIFIHHTPPQHYYCIIIIGDREGGGSDSLSCTGTTTTRAPATQLTWPGPNERGALKLLDLRRLLLLNYSVKENGKPCTIIHRVLRNVSPARYFN